ncbi:MAG TPA: tetratricopeptide repeat protein [Kofleriaceae bacterium]|nr:tetratricopeptide repeat protein [Kofleriaceae bacterium]
MTRVLLLVLLGAIAAVAAPSRVRAQPAPVVDKTQVARRYTDAGLTAAKTGDYDAAIEFYSRAYRLRQHPTLIFNMAEAHRLAGRTDQAVALYKRYLAEAPRGPLAADARDRIAAIDAQKAKDARKIEEARRAEDDRKAAAARKAEDERQATIRKAEEDRQAAARKAADDAGRAEQARTEREAAAVATPAAAPGATPLHDTGASLPAEAPGRSLRIAGLAAAAGGVVGVAVGVGFAIHGRTLSDELSKSGAMGGQFDPAKVRAGDRANTIAILGIAGGTALVAGGAALYWYGYTQGRSSERVSLAPLISDRVAGLVIAGRWR